MSDLKIWEGVFSTYSEAQTSITSCNNIFMNKSWYDHQLLMRNKVKSDFMPIVAPLLIPYMCGINKDGWKVLDWGGGIGLDYYRLSQHTNLNIENYTVVENRSFISKLNSKTDTTKVLQFSSFVPDKYFDIFYSVNSIHYLSDPISSMNDFILKCKPKSIVLGGVLISNTIKFYTNQVRDDSTATVCFFRA